MEWAWTSAEKELDRLSAMAIAELDAATSAAASSAASSSASGNAIGSLIGTLGSAFIMRGCWVAREVYGKQNSEWFVFRTWLQYDAPKWFKKLYMTHGENYAKLIAKVPPLKWATKQLMVGLALYADATAQDLPLRITVVFVTGWLVAAALFDRAARERRV